MLGRCGAPEITDLVVNTLGGCGDIEITDSYQFLIWQGVVVLSELIYNYFYFKSV